MKAKINWDVVFKTPECSGNDNWFRLEYNKDSNKFYEATEQEYYLNCYKIDNDWILLKKFFLTEKDIHNIKFNNEIDKLLT